MDLSEVFDIVTSVNKVLLVLLVLIASSAMVLSAVDYGRIIDPASPLYDYADLLYSLSSMSRPSTNRPWSEGEARLILEKLGASRLDPDGQELYDKAWSLVDEDLRFSNGKGFSFNAGADFSFEMYTHSNPEDFYLESGWARGYSRRKPLMHYYLEFNASDFFYTTFDANYQFGRASQFDSYTGYIGSERDCNGYVGSYQLASSAHYVSSSWFFRERLMTNFFTDTHDFSFIWPKRAILSFGGKNWNFSFSRDRLKIGDGRIGNLLVDDYSDFNDYSRLSVFVDGFKYDWILMYFNTLTSSSEEAGAEGRMMMIHTLEFRPWDWAAFKISENVMYRYPVLDLQFLNPAFIYHNLNNRGMFNALAYLEAEVQLFKGLELYGQYALDQARAPHEGFGQADSSGFVAGLEYSCQALDGFIQSYAELVSTTPLLYRRGKVDFIKVTRYYHQDPNNTSLYSGHMPVFEYIGFQFGGDTRALKVGAEYTRSGLGKLGAYGLLLDHGAMNMYMSHNTGGDNNAEANYPGQTPTGDVITRALNLGAKLNLDMEALFSWPGVSLECEFDWIGAWQYEKAAKRYFDLKVDRQLSLSLSARL